MQVSALLGAMEIALAMGLFAAVILRFLLYEKDICAWPFAILFYLWRLLQVAQEAIAYCLSY